LAEKIFIAKIMFEFYDNLTNLGKLIFYFSILVVLCSIFYQCYVCSFIPVQLIWRNQTNGEGSLVPTISSPAAEIAPVILTPTAQNIILPVEGFQNSPSLKNIFSSRNMGNVPKKFSSNSSINKQSLRSRIQASELATRQRDRQQKRSLSRDKRRESISDYFDRILQDVRKSRKADPSLASRRVRFNSELNYPSTQKRQRESALYDGFRTDAREARRAQMFPQQSALRKSLRETRPAPPSGLSRTNPRRNDRSKIILFYADWCSHCQNFKPIWNKFTKMFGKYIKTLSVNGDENAQILSKYGVDKFPTIILDNGKEKIEYDGDMTIDGLKMFVINETKNIKSPNRESIYV
jgi:thiol-disulfide isomerase/thioredoxin